VILNILVLYFKLLPWSWAWASDFLPKIGLDGSSEVYRALTLYLMNIYLNFVFIPFELYFHFVINERHGMNKMTLHTFIMD
jgi:STE24 endopeptidase